MIMSYESSEVNIKNNPLSTYEKHYKELLFSELLISIMEEDDKSVRDLAVEAKISPSVIQDLRSGKQKDIKVSNLIKITESFGYEVILQKGNECLALHDEMNNNKHQLSVVAYTR